MHTLYCVLRWSFSLLWRQSKSGPGRLVFNVYRTHTTRDTHTLTITHTTRHTHTHTHTHTYTLSLSFLNEESGRRRGRQPCNTHKKSKRWTSMPSAGFEPLIPAVKWPQTYALGSARYCILKVNTFVVFFVFTVAVPTIGVGLKIYTPPSFIQKGPTVVCLVRKDSSLWDTWTRNLDDNSYSELFVKKVCRLYRDRTLSSFSNWKLNAVVAKFVQGLNYYKRKAFVKNM